MPKPYADRSPWWIPQVDEAKLLKKRDDVLNTVNSLLLDLLQSYDVPFATLSDEAYTSARYSGITARRVWDKFFHKQSREDTIVVMLDLVDFKRINDDYGQAIGDLAISRFSTVLSEACESVREQAWPIHYGGDEFLVMLKAAALVDFKKIFMDKLRRCRVEIENSPPIDVRASGGYCQADGVMRWDDVKARAEQACKMAKSTINNPSGELLMYSETWENTERSIRERCRCGLQFGGSVSQKLIPANRIMKCPLCGREIELKEQKAAKASPGPKPALTTADS